MSCVSDHAADTGVVEATAALDHGPSRWAMAPCVNRCESLASGIKFAQAALEGVARRCGRLAMLAHLPATRSTSGLTRRTPSAPTGHPRAAPKSEDHERQPLVAKSIPLRFNPRPALGLSGEPADWTITAAPPYRTEPYPLAEPSDRRVIGPTEPIPAAPILDRIPDQNRPAETENPSHNGRRPRKRTTLSRYTTSIYNDLVLYWTHIEL